jgi:DNA-binding transcriptional regulator YiaG
MKITPEQIKKARSIVNETQEQFARRLTVTIMTISRWERGACECVDPLRQKIILDILGNAA